MIAKILHKLSLIAGYDEPERPAWTIVPIQTSDGRITKDEIKIILSIIENLGLAPRFENNDKTYKLVDVEMLKLFININNLKQYTYVKEERDCDDFMAMMNGDINHWDSDLAVGNIRGWKPDGSGHAWNWLIDTDKELWFIEPQQNKIFKPKELWKITKLEM